jgi:hypothetical protein
MKTIHGFSPDGLATPFKTVPDHFGAAALPIPRNNNDL